MDEESVFGLRPDQLDCLLSLGADDKSAETDKHEADTPQAGGGGLGLDEKSRSSEALPFLSAIVEQPGGWINHYKLLSALGEGGMGIVYLADQDQPIKRRVALKVIKPGMDSKRIIARFEAERQALALLDHPNIAHVYDAGTTETGRPYFVMDYVKGSPITDYCDHHKLSIQERLNLFRQVCLAVHHAHQKGIVHRDIKPSNILVSLQDDQAVPKIIDFGVAKAVSRPLTDSTLFTEQDQLVGTPEYMSPEQAGEASEDIDIRSDIYSLGVVLYQLLTGVLPFDSDALREGGIDHVRQVIREQDPKTPSNRLSNLGDCAETVAQQRQTNVTSLARRLHRELEWIPLKAMRKDRTRRYRSAAEFADDIENYLLGSPLIAGPESITYRVGKFVGRHRIPVIAVASIAVVLVLATLVSTVLYVRGVIATESNRRLLYVNQITLAHLAYREADIDRAQALLANCSTDFRDFAWYYLWRLCQIVPATPIIEHPKPVNAVAFSPIGKTLATASDNKVRLWDPSTCSLKATLEGHTGIVKSLAFSPDGTMLATGSEDRNLILWDVAGQRELRRFTEQNGVVASLVFSSNGKTVAAAIQSGKVVIWDVNNGESVSLSEEDGNGVFGVAFSPDNKLLAATGVQKTTLWDLATRKSANFGGHRAFVNSAAFLFQGQVLATTGNDGTLRFWDVATGEQLKTIPAHTAPVLSMALSPDGAVLATGSADSTIRLWDTTTGHEIKRFRGHKSEVRCVSFSADGKVLASAGKDGMVRLWDLTPRTDSDTLVGHNRVVNGIVFSPDSQRLISTSYGGTANEQMVSMSHEHTALKMWDVTSGLDVSSTLGNLTLYSTLCADLSPDGKTLAIGTTETAGSADLVLWDMDAKKQIGRLPHQASITEVVFAPDGKTLVTQTYDCRFRLWDVATWHELIRLKGYGSYYGAVAFSPDGSKLALPYNDDLAVTLWNTSDLLKGRGHSPVATFTGHIEQINAVAFSPDGATLASGSNDTAIKLWDIETHREIATLAGHTSNVHCLAFSPDGRTLASGGNDGTVRLWNLMLQEQVAVIEGHGSTIWDVAFSPDGHTLASSSFDGTIKLWRATTEREIQTQSAPAK
ncbi:MAG: serine/threonine protein kinase [Sedimentisphaerales bacterium]|jgi:WD40 repeat protein/serine/threonine protein kinase